MILPIYLTSTIDAGLGGRSLTTVFSRVGQVPADLVQARFVQAGLHAAHNGVGRALGAAHDAAPYRPSVPLRRWVELRARTRPPIPEKGNMFRRETSFHCEKSAISATPPPHSAGYPIGNGGMHAGSHQFRGEPVPHDSPELVGPLEISDADVVSFGCPTDRLGNSDVSLPAPR